MLKKMGNNVGARTQPSLTPFEMGEAARERPIVLHLTLLTFIELAENGEKFWGQPRHARVFHSLSWLTVSKAFVRSTKAAYRPMFCSLHFSCICLSTKIMSTVPLLDLNPHWLSGVFSCAIVGMSLFSKTRAKILPAMESRVMPQKFDQSDFSPLFLC